jgi:hypothetical protein
LGFWRHGWTSDQAVCPTFLFFSLFVGGLGERLGGRQRHVVLFSSGASAARSFGGIFPSRLRRGGRARTTVFLRTNTNTNQNTSPYKR